MSSLLVFKKVYRLEIQSVMLVFSTQLCELLVYCPSNLLWFTSPLPTQSHKYRIYRQCVARRRWWVLSCFGDHILQDFIIKHSVSDHIQNLQYC
jgi:hypothetical protein